MLAALPAAMASRRVEALAKGAAVLLGGAWCVRFARRKAKRMDAVTQVAALCMPKLRGSAEEREGLGYIAIMASLAVFRIFVHSRSMYIHRDIVSAIHTRDLARFWRVILANLGFGVGQAIHRQGLGYFSGLLFEVFRRRLTARMHATYFRSATFYQLSQISHCDVDERISEDCKVLCRTFADLHRQMLNSLCTTVYFTTFLASYSGWLYAAAPVAYLMVSFWVSGNLGGVRHKDAFSIYLPVRVADLNIAGDAGGDRSAERPGRESVWFVPQVAS